VVGKETERNLIKDANSGAISRKSLAIWRKEEGLVEIMQMKGNFWKKMGFSMNSKNYLYPEEALLVSEKNQILISFTAEDFAQNKFMNQQELFQAMLTTISLPVYLTYSKLKVDCTEVLLFV
jgi:hypothetical protein